MHECRFSGKKNRTFHQDAIDLRWRSWGSNFACWFSSGKRRKQQAKIDPQLRQPPATPAPRAVAQIVIRRLPPAWAPSFRSDSRPTEPASSSTPGPLERHHDENRPTNTITPPRQLTNDWELRTIAPRAKPRRQRRHSRPSTCQTTWRHRNLSASVSQILPHRHV